MQEEDEFFADTFGEAKETRPQEPPKAQDPPKEEAPPPDESKQAQEPASEEPPPQQEPEPPPQQQLPQEEYLALRRSRDEAKETKTQLEIERLKAANLARELEQYKQQQARPQEPPPDIYENPDGYRQYLEAQQDARINQLKLQQSEFFATREYGAELVDTVKQWASRLDEATANHLLAQPSPFHAAVERYRQEQSSSTLREYDFNLDKLKEKWLEEYKAQNPAPSSQAAPQQQQQPAPNLPPKVAGEGGHVAQAPKQSEGDFFRSVFTR